LPFDVSTWIVRVSASTLFDGAYVRLERAEEHLAELRSISSDLIKMEREVVLEGIRANMKFGPSAPIPLKYSVLIGETIYNLRASLDYLVYQLALLDSGTEQDRTQFPIYDTQNGFRGRRRSCLRGINGTHTAAIERLQPYNGVDWTKWLQSLSNPDKHRHLIIPKHDGTVKSTTTPDPAKPTKVEVHLRISQYIAFNEGLPVIDTLEKITLEVANVLASFRGEF